MKSFKDISRNYTAPIDFDSITEYHVLKFKSHNNWVSSMRKKQQYRMKDHRKQSSIWYGHLLYQRIPILSIPLYYDGYIHSDNYFKVVSQLMGAPILITKDIQKISEGMKDITHYMD